jgi:hypothetical protein
VAAVVTAHRGLAQTRARLAFKVFDVNDSNSIAAKDLEASLEAGLAKVSPKDAAVLLDAMFDKVTDSQEGAISVDEFIGLYDLDDCQQGDDQGTHGTHGHHHLSPDSGIATLNTLELSSSSAPGARSGKSGNVHVEETLLAGALAANTPLSTADELSNMSDTHEPFFILKRLARVFWKNTPRGGVQLVLVLGSRMRMTVVVLATVAKVGKAFAWFRLGNKAPRRPSDDLASELEQVASSSYYSCTL